MLPRNALEWALPILAAALTGCCATTYGAHGYYRDIPAVIVQPDDASRAALQRTVSAALRGAPVGLADDALTDTSTLVVQRIPVRDASGMLANGRDLERPHLFKLVKNGSACVLVADATGDRFTLDDTHCAPR
jgi:hypothetical protein